MFAKNFVKFLFEFLNAIATSSDTITRPLASRKLYEFIIPSGLIIVE